MKTPDDISGMFRTRPSDAHKGSMGHALLAVGSQGMAGAALLSARACMRSGAGKLTVLTPECNRLILQLGVPEAIVKGCESVRGRSLAVSGSELTGFQAIGIGPGLGQSREAGTLVESVLGQASAPLVMDADALNLLGDHPKWWKMVPPQTILTPHPGEVARLTGAWTDREDCVRHCQRLAQDKRVVVVCKGHPTVICFSNGDVALNETGNPGMATAGAGDVLTGIITALLARGYSPREAARMGVWLHGMAGDLAAEELGQESMVAGDLVSHLAGAFKTIRK